MGFTLEQNLIKLVGRLITLVEIAIKLLEKKLE